MDGSCWECSRERAANLWADEEVGVCGGDVRTGSGEGSRRKLMPDFALPEGSMIGGGGGGGI